MLRVWWGAFDEAGAPRFVVVGARFNGRMGELFGGSAVFAQRAALLQVYFLRVEPANSRGQSACCAAWAEVFMRRNENGRQRLRFRCRLRDTLGG